jgi:hypothetical protein
MISLGSLGIAVGYTRRSGAGISSFDSLDPLAIGRD